MKLISETRRFVGGLMLVIVLAIGGCGGTSSNTLDKPQLAAKANEFCAQTNKALKALLGQAGTSAQDNARRLAAEIPAIQTELNHMKSLTPAGGVKSDYQTYVSSEAQVLAGYRRARARAIAHDTSGMNSALLTTSKPGAALLAAARRLGWTVCEQT